MDDVIIGVDEAGYGAWAGPLAIGAMIIDTGAVEGVRDSKKIAEARRYQLYDELRVAAKAYTIVLMSPDFIDRNGLDAAWDKGVTEAVLSVRKKYGSDVTAIIDGQNIPEGLSNAECMIGGDDKVYQISAASIAAKAHRDSKMLAYDKMYPQYGFGQHKGYGTKQHIKALQEFGACVIHRKSYKPVQNPNKPLPKEELEFTPERVNNIINKIGDIRQNPKVSDWEIIFFDDMKSKLSQGKRLSPRQMFFLDAIRRRHYKHK